MNQTFHIGDKVRLKDGDGEYRYTEMGTGLIKQRRV